MTGSRESKGVAIAFRRRPPVRRPSSPALAAAPVLLVNGNHEQASLANLDGTVAASYDLAAGAR